MRLAHIACCKRSEGHAGGVPLFGHYMARCLGATEWGWADYDGPGKNCDEPTAAMILGRWLVETGRLDDVDGVIVDGFWGRGLDGFDGPIFSVAHNTWRGIGRACKSANAMRLGEIQAPEYERRLTVAVSNHVAKELRELYGVDAVATIINGIDIDEFRPAPKPERETPLVLYPSHAWAKGGDVVAALKARMPDFEFRMIGAGIGEEAAAIAAGDIYLSPSRSDGCAYAGLQALACGLPVVASRTGLFAEIADGALDDIAVGLAVDAEWEKALRQVNEHRQLLGQGARRWAEQHAGLDRWAEQWRRLLRTFITTA